MLEDMKGDNTFVRVFIIIILGVLVSAIIRLVSGEGGRRVTDERRRRMFQDATMTSWQTMIFYILIRLITLVPSLKQIVHDSHPTWLSSAIFTHGGDVLIAGAVGYLLGYVISSIKNS